jgi:uroporphyrinogen-III decarboxylase
MIRIIHESGGFARIHCHGNIRMILDDIAGMGADAIDPIEPPPQGDVTLEYVREKYGEQLVLFGNIECADIETLNPKDFKLKVKIALDQGTKGNGRGFVLMPSASPYGRILQPHVVENYRIMLDLANSQ